jgi:hypothetical protein
MTSLGTLSRLTVVALLTAAASCADNITQGDSQAEPSASASEPAPSVSDLTPILDITTRAWNNGTTDIPPLSGFYYVEVNGTGFQPGAGYESRTVTVFLDGMVFQLGGARGVIPADGTYRIKHITNCPSYIREVYAIVKSSGKWTESKHIAPAC